MNHSASTKGKVAFQRPNVWTPFPNDFQNGFCFEPLKMEQLIVYGHLNIDCIPWESTCISWFFTQRTVSLMLLLVSVTLILIGHLMLLLKNFQVLQRIFISTNLLRVY